MKKIIIAAMVIVTSCAAPDYNISDIGWMEGKWMGHEGSNSYIEQWSRNNDSLYLGQGYFLEGTDTLFREELKLVDNGSGVSYVAFPQNMNKAEFILKEANDSLAVFSNPDHDFPKEIRYTLKGDSMFAVLTGTDNGRDRKDTFRWKRVK